MKRFSLIVLLLFVVSGSFGQKKTYVGLYGGAGLATANNYDVALSGGLDLVKCVSTHMGIGINLFYQSFAMAYDNEVPPGVTGGYGTAGAILLNQSAFVFAAPKIDVGLGRKQDIHFYVNAGPGFNMGGEEALRKWDKNRGSSLANYDSTIITSGNIKSMVMRIGFGFTEYLYTSRHWRFTVTEDFGFVPRGISTTSDYTNPVRTEYTPRSLTPRYFSLQIGISHVGFHEDR